MKKPHSCNVLHQYASAGKAMPGSNKTAFEKYFVNRIGVTSNQFIKHLKTLII